MALWCVEVRDVERGHTTPVYAVLRTAAQDEAERYGRECCEGEFDVGSPVLMLKETACDDCPGTFAPGDLEIVAEGGHGQGVDGHPTMLLCGRCHAESHTGERRGYYAQMVGWCCDACFPETATAMRHERLRARLASSQVQLDNDALERLHADIFKGVGT